MTTDPTRSTNMTTTASTVPVPEKLYNAEGHVAVLVSGGTGAGWSTWADEWANFLLFDKGLVVFAYAQQAAYDDDDEERRKSILYSLDKEVEAYLKARGYEGYLGGWSGVQVKLLTPGTKFIINEYDGAETLRVMNDFSWITA